MRQVLPRLGGLARHQATPFVATTLPDLRASQESRCTEASARTVYEQPIMRPRSILTQKLDSRQVFFRFLFRLLLLIAFATFATRGFGTTLSTLLAMSAIFCAVAGAIRHRGDVWPRTHILGRGNSLRGAGPLGRGTGLNSKHLLYAELMKSIQLRSRIHTRP